MISMFIYVTLLIVPQPIGAFSEQVIQKGATGDDVVELQSRLQYIGFYNEQIDGVFGWSTYWAVRNYQEEFGMDVDGLVGEQTKAMLERSTDFDKEWVHRMIREGRKFTYYGSTPKDIQKGPKGSSDAKQAPGQGEQAGEQQETDQTTPDQTEPPAEQPSPGGDAGQQPGEGIDQQTPPQEQEDSPIPQEQPAEQVPPADQGEQGSPEPPAEEEVHQEDNDTGIESAINVPEGFTDNDIQIMAQAVYGEARGEPYVGQVAVAAVILNRIQSPTFPNTASGVIFEPRAFTAVADGQIYMEPNETARKAVLDAINGQDPSGNALYYFNPDTATSGWIWTRPQIKKIGKHIFCK
ncbi:spore cortex-lytic enzyme [Evansella sp. AB-P1]|uniref:spore cortex-lytic enzyme n=1 Tax=Evansella sp. AB-P1 TaxID=3037653 RepID=UPI00241F0CBF|nr:spore cortex-lytic enzyme [Evansella sp. AB-P1]MDG5787623.1 spore cortex-lytic enzyme [Evansella sp. AB-P1]